MAGYSQTPLRQKLGIKEDQRARFIDAPAELSEWLGNLPPAMIVRRPPYDFVLVFVNTTKKLEDWLVRLREQLSQDGMIWVAWYKKASKRPTELTEDIIRDTALPLGLVDIKVCAISEEWSGLKLVIRKSERRK
jgi:hypothetical protein